MLKAGIIGLGIGEQHLEGYLRHPACEVTVLCDFSDEKYTMARQKYSGLRVTKDASEVLEDPDIDIVSIASFDNYHYEKVVTALTYDKHVFVEKPVCLYEGELIHIRELLNERPHLKMSSNLILRMCPRFRKLRKSIDEGHYGDLFYVEGDYNYGRINKITEGWRGEIDFYSVVCGGGVHMVDLLSWLTRQKITEVSAFGNNIATKGTGFRYNDMVVSTLKFESGMVGKMAANFGCVFPHFHQVVIYGTKRTFMNGREKAFVYESRDPSQPPTIVNDPYPGYHKGDLIYSFVDSIVQGTPAEVPTDEVFSAMSVCFAIEKAMTSSGVVIVNYI